MTKFEWYSRSECPVSKAKREGADCWRQKIKQLSMLPDQPMVITGRVFSIKKEQGNA